ncbi:MAG: hotdog fold thioesterase [Rhizobacter sp.]
MTAIWKQPASLERLTAFSVNTASDHLGIEFTEIGDDYLKARMPVDHRTKQPAGILHGGVSVVLAETLGSCAAAFAAPWGHRVVGLDINANHIRPVSSGWVTGVARPVHVGRTTQVWAIEITNEEGKVTCVSRITMAVLVPAESPTPSASTSP